MNDTMIYRDVESGITVKVPTVMMLYRVSELEALFHQESSFELRLIYERAMKDDADLKNSSQALKAALMRAYEAGQLASQRNGETFDVVFFGGPTSGGKDFGNNGPVDFSAITRATSGG